MRACARDGDVMKVPSITRTWGCTAPLPDVFDVEVSEPVPIHTLWAGVHVLHSRALRMDACPKELPWVCKDAHPRQDFLQCSKCLSNCTQGKSRAGGDSVLSVG